jgi:hypothetical protein
MRGVRIAKMSKFKKTLQMSGFHTTVLHVVKQCCKIALIKKVAVYAHQPTLASLFLFFINKMAVKIQKEKIYLFSKIKARLHSQKQGKTRII